MKELCRVKIFKNKNERNFNSNKVQVRSLLLPKSCSLLLMTWQVGEMERKLQSLRGLTRIK